MPEPGEATVLRGRYRLSIVSFQLWVAILAFYAGLSYFVGFLAQSGPARAVEMKFPQWVWVWSVMYGAGGFGMLLGLVRRSPRVEGAGVSLLGSGAMVAFIATLLAGAAVLPTIIGLGGIVAACGMRFCVLKKLS